MIQIQHEQLATFAQEHYEALKDKIDIPHSELQEILLAQPDRLLDVAKKYKHNESYMDELLTQYEGTLFKNREDLQRLVSGGYISDEEIGKRPISKLIKDISIELGLI